MCSDNKKEKFSCMYINEVLRLSCDDDDDYVWFVIDSILHTVLLLTLMMMIQKLTILSVLLNKILGILVYDLTWI